MAQRYLIYSSAIGIVSLAIMMRLAMLAGHIVQELPLLALVVILMITMFGIQFKPSIQPTEQSDTDLQLRASKKLGNVVMLAFLAIVVAFCAGMLSRGGLR